MTKQFVLSDRLVRTGAYGGEMFLAKMQLQTGTAAPQDRGHITIYDRRMTFVASQGLRRVRGGDAGARGYIAVMMHRWAKRTDDWELTVCLDREPTTDVKW